MLVYPDMHNAFRLNLDKSSSLVGNPDFLPEEIDYWLNEAQDRFIKQRMFGNNNKREGFEQGTKRINDLHTLVCNTYDTYYSAGPPTFPTIPLHSSSLGSNVVEATIPLIEYNPYMYYISSILYTGTGAISLNSGEIIDSKNLTKYISDSINTPFIRRPLVYFYNNVTSSIVINNQTIAFIYDPSSSFYPTSFNMIYIKMPRTLTSQTITGYVTYPSNYLTNTCELPVETHEEIVNIAVGLVIENNESPRVQSFTQLNQSNIE